MSALPVSRRQRGSTLLEIMLTMAVVLIGMLGLFRVLSVASSGSRSSQHITQATARAQQVIEAIRTAPPSVLDCLIANPATSWTLCEQRCMEWLQNQPNQVAVPSPQSCVFASLGVSTQDRDASQQRYAVVFDNANFADGSSWVQNTSLKHSVYDVQVTIGWKDDGTALPTGACLTAQHCVSLRTSVYRDPQR